MYLHTLFAVSFPAVPGGCWEAPVSDPFTGGHYRCGCCGTVNLPTSAVLVHFIIFSK